MPSSRVLVFALQNAHPKLATVAAAAHCDSSKTNLRNAVAEDWQRRHSLIMDSEAGPLHVREGIEEDAAVISQCYKIGMCICCKEGKRLHVFVGAVYKAFKAAHPFGSAERVRATDGFAFLHFRSIPGLAGSRAVPNIFRSRFSGGCLATCWPLVSQSVSSYICWSVDGAC